MSDRATSPVKEAASAHAPVERADDAVVGDVSGERIEEKSAAGVSAPKSKEETSVTDAPKGRLRRAHARNNQ